MDDSAHCGTLLVRCGECIKFRLGDMIYALCDRGEHGLSCQMLLVIGVHLFLFEGEGPVL